MVYNRSVSELPALWALIYSVGNNKMSSSNEIVSSPIIWTPRFIVLFASLLVSGLSVASILIQVSLNGVISAEAVFLFYTAPALGSSLLLAFRAQNLWGRAGGVMASVWTVLMGLHFVIP